MKEAIGIQITLDLEFKLQKIHLQQNITIFSATHSCILNRFQDGNVDTHPMTSELEKNEFMVYGHNIKQVYDIQVTFILEIKLQKYNL